ncbi:MAG: hypothetical protein Q9167_000501 [Letrouitia subvulpina]
MLNRRQSLRRERYSARGTFQNWTAQLRHYLDLRFRIALDGSRTLHGGRLRLPSEPTPSLRPHALGRPATAEDVAPEPQADDLLMVEQQVAGLHRDQPQPAPGILFKRPQAVAVDSQQRDGAGRARYRQRRVRARGPQARDPD